MKIDYQNRWSKVTFNVVQVNVLCHAQVTDDVIDIRQVGLGVWVMLQNLGWAAILKK